MADYFNFDTPVDRSDTCSMKWDKYRGKEIIPLWVADMDFLSPPAVRDALVRRIGHGVFGYTLPPQELNEIIISLMENEYGWKIEKEWIVWLPGLVTGINLVCRAVGKDADDVMTAIPVYPPFLTGPGNSRRNLIKVPLVEINDSWGFDFESMEKAITPRTRLFLLCNPHNPVGRVYERDELASLASICIKHNIVISSDEIHCGLLLEPGKRHIPIASLSPETADRTITLMAPSKTFNLPGLGCSFAIISNAALRKSFNMAMNGIVPRVNTLGYIAAIAAYRDSHDWHAALLDYLRENRDLVLSSVNKMPGLSSRQIEATYLAWIDTRESGIEDPVKFFEAAGVGLFDGNEFGTPGFVRLNFGCQRSLLKKALERMTIAVQKRAEGMFYV
ncbi:MAG: PatB family C-S lyase [Proteobacteria bacterium]|nr:PatB family C-S lyase [Pseudomonadota bacterium]